MSELLMEKEARRLRRTTRWSALPAKRVSKEQAGFARLSNAFRWIPIVALLFALRLAAAEVIPPAPANHFNDYAGMVPAAVAQQLNNQLAQFERDTSNQIVVAIYPTMQSDSSIEDYTVRVAQAWGVGQKDRKNGAVLFIFQKEHTLFLQVGYGLEGALPDARAKQIIENEITPRFRAGDFAGGISAGVSAILASVRGEYQGTGATVNERGRSTSRGGSGWMIGVVIALIVFRAVFGNRRSTLYSRRGRRGMWMFPGGGWGGGSGWGGGGSSGGGGGTFSGGGGSFGGGGAGGRW